MTNIQIKHVPVNTISRINYTTVQIEELAEAIQRLSYTLPVLVDRKGWLMAGDGYLQAIKALGLKRIPTLCPDDMSPDQKIFYVTANEKFDVDAGLDLDLTELKAAELRQIGFPVDVDLTKVGINLLGASEMMESLECLT